MSSLAGGGIFIYLLLSEIKLIEPVPWAYNKVYFEYYRCFKVIIICRRRRFPAAFHLQEAN